MASLINERCTPLLVGGTPTALKNMSSSVGVIIPNIWKNNYFTSFDPHHDIYTFCYWQIFWQSI